MEKKPPVVSLKTMLALSLPMLVSQSSETVMLFISRYFLSLLGKNYIAAAMSGGLTSFVFGALFSGMVGYVNAPVAQYFGARQYPNCYKATSQSLWLSLFCFPLVLLTIPLVHAFFQWAGHSPAQLELEFTYFKILMYGSLFSFIKSGLTGYFLGTGRAAIVMAANIAGMLISLPLNYLFIFGWGSLPASGIEGAAFASICGSVTTCLILGFAYLRDLRGYRQENPVQGVWRINRKLMGKLLRFGLPAGVELFTTVFLFNFFLQLMYSYSEDLSAAVTITFNYDSLSYVPLLGIAVAITALTGQQMGAGSVAGAKKVVGLACRVVYTYAGLLVVFFLSCADFLVGIFAGGLTPAEKQTILPQAALLLRLATIYILADATHLTFAGALRGAGDTGWVMFIATGLHVVMATGAYLMIKVWHWAPLTVWLYYIAFVLALGLAMLLRYLAGSWKKIQMIEKG